MAIHTWGGGAARTRTSASPSTNDGSVLATCSTQDLALPAAPFCDHRRGNPGLQPTDITVRIGESTMGRSAGRAAALLARAFPTAALNARRTVKD